MIEIVEGFGDNVVAIRAAGRLTREDYDKVLIPRIAAAAKAHAKIRCYYEVGTDFAGVDAGALWDDFKVGVEYWTRWERVAAVTDVAWIGHMVNAFRFLIPGKVRVFTTGEKDAARAWVDEA